MAEALLEASVQNFRIRHPEVRILKCGQGIYDVQGSDAVLGRRRGGLYVKRNVYTYIYI